MSRTTPLFHRGHYNIIAAQIREPLSAYIKGKAPENVGARNALVNLALSLAKRFAEDNPKKPGDDTYYFRPEMFLDACSPDPDMYPLSELWTEE